MSQFGQPGERIGYEVFPHPAGAPPIVLLHGFTASSASFLSNLRALRDRFTVITVDLLGHGASDSPPETEPYRPHYAVARVIGLLDELGIEKALLCGHSLGGALALRLALDWPERVAGLVIINSNSAAGTPRWREEVQPRMVEMAERLRAEGTGFLKRSRIYPAASPRLPADARAQLAADFARLSPLGVAGTAEGLVAQVNVLDRLQELNVPTLIVVGSRDADFVANAPRLAAAMPIGLATTVGIEDAGHAANLEQPEAFHRALFAFAENSGYLAALPQGATDEGIRRTVLLALGAVFLVTGIGLLVAAVLNTGGGNSPATAIPLATNTPARTSSVAGVRATSPSNGQTPAAAVNPATPTGAPSTATPAVVVATATIRPSSTTTPGPTLTPGNTPTPTATPSPTATATLTATATPSGPSVTVSGPASASVGGSATYSLSITPANYFSIEWFVDNGATFGSGTNPASRTVTFPAPGCYAVGASVLFKDQVARAATIIVAVGRTC